MGESPDLAGEPVFLGEGRHRLVAEVVSRFDTVCAGSTPHWVALTAPTGTGKTRIVREVYRRLASERQPGGRYWPSSLEFEEGPFNRVRKNVHPDIRVYGTAALPYLWWGIEVAVRGGADVSGLKVDLERIADHEEAALRQWRDQALRRTRLREWAARNKSIIGEVSADESVGALFGMAATHLLGAAIPGGSATALAVRRLIRQADGLPRYSYLPDTGTLDEKLSRLLELIATSVPIVVVVEDLHLAGADVVELVSNLIRLADARILLVTTSTTTVDLPNLDEQRITRFGPETFEPLSVDELSQLVVHFRPTAQVTSARVLAVEVRNPLALALTAGVPRIFRALDTGGLTLAELRDLPSEVEGLLITMFKALSDELKAELQVRAALAPGAAFTDGEHRWFEGAASAAMQLTSWAIGSATELTFWVTCHDAIGQFTDPSVFRFVLKSCRDELDPGALRGVAAAYASLLERLKSEPSAGTLHEMSFAALLSGGLIDPAPGSLLFASMALISGELSIDLEKIRRAAGDHPDREISDGLLLLECAEAMGRREFQRAEEICERLMDFDNEPEPKPTAAASLALALT